MPRVGAVLKLVAPLALLAALAAQVAAQKPQTATTERRTAAEKTAAAKNAPPPKWDKKLLEAFFTDARSHLKGEFTSSRGAGASADGAPAGDGTGVLAGDIQWSKVVAAATIEDEIKATVQPLAATVATTSTFKSGGFKESSVHLSTLAVMFGVISQYDTDIRWKKDAPGLRQAFARASFNSKVSSDSAFKETKLRSSNIADLVKGDPPKELPEAEAKVSWSEVAYRPPLMRRMGAEGYNKALKVYTADKGAYNAHKDELLHEAQIVAVIAHVIQDPGYEFGDDENYRKYAKDLQKQALEAAEAIKADSFERTQAAAVKVNQACSNCHGDFRQG